MLKKRQWLLWFIVLVLLGSAVFVFKAKKEQPPISFRVIPQITKQTNGNTFWTIEGTNPSTVTNLCYWRTIERKGTNGLSTIKAGLVYSPPKILAPGKSSLMEIGMVNKPQGEYRVIIAYYQNWSAPRRHLYEWMINHQLLFRFLTGAKMHHATSEWFQVTTPTIPPATNSIAHTNAAKFP